MTSRERYDFVIIGSGPAGQQAAIQACKAGRTVLMVEKDRRLGGACVHKGTIPSKTLRETTVVMNRFLERNEGVCKVDLAADVRVESLLTSLDRVIAGHVQYMGARLDRLGVELVQGKASFVAPHEVEVKDPRGSRKVVHGEFVVIATGSTPRRPPEIEIDHERIYDSDSILSMTYLPESLIVLGGGVIASEYASIFSALGVQVTMVDRADRPLCFLDADLTDRFLEAFERTGGTYIGCDTPKRVEWNGFDAAIVETESGHRLEAEKVLVALGRVPNIRDLNLDAAGVTLTDRGHVQVDMHCQTSTANVYACGDVIGPPALASSSMEQGRRAALHALGMDVGVPAEMIPVGIYSVPELASVGLSEMAARERHGDVLVGRAAFDELARAQIAGHTEGLLKVVADPNGEKILGISILGEGATELIHVGQMAMITGASMQTFRENIFNFPTLAEAYRVAALDIEMQRRKRAEGEGVEHEPGPSPACSVLTEDGCSPGDGTGNELPASPADGSSATDRAA